MALANTLNTNEIKGSAGTEIEFQRKSTGPGEVTVFAQIGESPNKPYRLSVKHTEVGTGFDKRRRSVIRFDKTVASDVDSTRTVTPLAYTVIEAPIGGLTTMAEVKNVLANLMSFLSTTGAATTVLFDCTGTGAVTLIDGTL